MEKSSRRSSSTRWGNQQSNSLNMSMSTAINTAVEVDLTGSTCLTMHSTRSTKETFMTRAIGLCALSMLLIGLSGCSYLFYPRAADYVTQAKGASGVETLINLTTMMETTASKAKGGKGVDTA